jgi:hypothetical protein
MARNLSAVKTKNFLPVQAKPILRKRIGYHASQLVTPQSCNPFNCAGIVAACVGACASGIGSVACIGCLGGAYDECKGCF